MSIYGIKNIARKEGKKMALLIIVRHGQSAWNLENRFTGEVDIDLTADGELEAKKAGVLLKKYVFRRAYTSVLKRAVRTLEIILDQNNQKDLPVVKTAALNERNYGDLQGLNKKETEQKYGAQQVLLWRRSFDVVPPNGESLKNTYDRVVPYYQMNVEPKLRNGENILIVAHGNSLRALMMFLEKIAPEDIVNVTLATGAPRAYALDSKLMVTDSFYIS
jgi:2,3-bisphosphoglycerate-dependent phosphoglycerate mutase